MDAVVLLFAKVPRAGDVKTRLTPLLRPWEAARLYTAFLRDTVRTVLSLEVDVRLYLAPPLPEKEMLGLPSGVSVHKQRGEGLGVRMERAFEETLGEGGDRVVLLGTDHPTLPRSFVRRGLGVLDAPHSVCIGPTRDGGFYLLGMNASFPQLFREMSYSHSDVFADTLSRIKQTDADLTVLPQWYDVDRPEDVERLAADLGEEGASAPNTARVMDRLGVEARL